MRPTLVASLLLSPVLASASAFALQPKADTGASAQSPAITTGVTAPEIVDGNTLHIQPDAFDQTASVQEQLVLKLKVDATGHAQDIQIVKSTNPHYDVRVIDAVQKSRFRPAKLDNQPVPVEMNLVVVVQPRVQ